MKFSKKAFIFFTTITTTMLPTFFVISCGDNKSWETQPSTKVLSTGIKIGDIQVFFKSNKSKIKINELKDLDFEIKINPKFTNIEDEYYKEMKKSIEEYKVEYKDFLIPILNKDKDSRIFFKIESQNELSYVKFSNIFLNNEPIENNIINLNEKEIKNLIIEKLNDDKTFSSNLHDKIKNYLINTFKNEKEENQTFDKWWNQKNNDEFLKNEIANWFKNNYTFFDTGELKYDNFHISNINLTIEKINNREKISVAFSISSSSLLNHPDTSYEIPPIIFFI